MSISIKSKPDYSFMFQNMNSSRQGYSSVSSLTNILSDYKQIKSGSYGKLMKAYYKGEDKKTAESTAKLTKKTETAASKRLTAVSNSADELKESADKLLKTDYSGKDTTYLINDVKDYVKKYNSTIEAADQVTNNNVLGRASKLLDYTAVNSNALSKIGITVKNDYSLELNEDTFKKAKVSDVQDMFGKAGSYGYSVSAQASLVDFAAENAKASAGLYNSKGGTYADYSNGSIYNSFF